MSLQPYEEAKIEYVIKIGVIMVIPSGQSTDNGVVKRSFNEADTTLNH